MKQLGKKKLVTLVAGALAVIAFIMAFVAPLKQEFMGEVIKAEFADVYFGQEVMGTTIKGAIIPFIGFILMLAAGVYLILSNFIEIKADKTLKIVAIAVLVVSAILVFLTESFYLNAVYSSDMYAALSAEQISAAKEANAEILKLGAGPLFGGILAILAAAGAAVAQFVIKD